jgi:hypothetical protein
MLIFKSLNKERRNLLVNKILLIYLKLKIGANFKVSKLSIMLIFVFFYAFFLNYLNSFNFLFAFKL